LWARRFVAFSGGRISRVNERFLTEKILGKKNEALRFCGRRLNEGHCILHAARRAAAAETTMSAGFS
jgi:hypothetical protein